VNRDTWVSEVRDAGIEDRASIYGGGSDILFHNTIRKGSGSKLVSTMALP
jgi:hypothetical protein